MSKFFASLAAAAAAIGVASAASVSVDLSTWSAEGAGTWTRAADNNSVFQSRNGNPTVFFNGLDSQGLQLSGTIEVQETRGDDDFIGFVLGYNAGDLTNSAADYILIDWKQDTQALSSTVVGTEGLAISRVQGAPTFNEAWSHSGVVTELARATNLGSTGWQDRTVYDFDLVFTGSRIQVFVDDVLELDVTGTFANGSFGFYNLSQPRVNYGALTTQDAPPVPVPAAALLFAPAIGAFAMKRRKK